MIPRITAYQRGDSEMLTFSLFDLRRRLEDLRAWLSSADAPKKPVKVAPIGEAMTVLIGVAPVSVFAAIEVHAKASDELWALHEESHALGPQNADHLPIEAATVAAELGASQTLINTAPSTLAGLRALEAHLREDRHRSAQGIIKITSTTETGRTYAYSSWGHESVDRLIAKRLAEIDNTV
jgi:hypothetical protein